MDRRTLLGSLGALAVSVRGRTEEPAPVLHVELDAEEPGKSRAWFAGEEEKPFAVGFGRDGYRGEGETFAGGSSLLGKFAVNAILTRTSFSMADELVAESGKPREWLAGHLFANMNSIDFDGDGRGGEYGDAFIGLEPLDTRARQPFHFGDYRGVFRWYSYAIHGTQDEERVGKRVTGGCLNVAKSDLAVLVERIKLGDRVEVRARK